jgi:hypothetical protein
MKIKPTLEDIEEFRPVKCTYLISESVSYEKPVKLFNDLGIKVSSFGKYISQVQFLEIQKGAIRII